jgi:hypothetical protein
VTHPFVLKGALVQVADDIMALTPNVLAFQYNPATLSRTIEPFQPRQTGDEASKDAPAVQPHEPTESIDLTLELDASDELAGGHPIALTVGVADRIAALEKMLQPTKGLFADLVATTGALFDGDEPAVPERQTVPIIFFVWGPGRMLPVRITSFTVEEQAFNVALFPIHASVAVSLEVLTPSMFRCREGFSVELARAAYEFHRSSQDTLAATHFASNVVAGLSLLGGL